MTLRIRIALSLLGVIAFAYLVWIWVFCRFYVGPNEMAIITTKFGKALPHGQILAQPGEMGIQEEVLGEGRHFRDPIMNDREIRPVIEIAPGKIGMVKAQGGADLPAGEFMAEPGQKGVWRRVLGPGKYRMNPYGYEVTVVDALSIPVGYAGVLTSLSGTQAPSNAFAAAGQKGVKEAILQPGLYYLNKNEYRVNVLEVGVNQVSLLGKDGGAVITKTLAESGNAAMNALQSNTLQEQQVQRQEYFDSDWSGSAASSKEKSSAANRSRNAQAPGKPDTRTQQTDVTAGVAQILNEFVEFPSRDGFQISLDMTVEFELLPGNLAAVFMKYGDLPAVVDKIIMPQILSITRNKGSQYRAMDFIVGEGREKFQKDMTDALIKTLLEKQIVIHNALIRHVEVPMQILDPIQKASLAIEQDLTNKERQNTARKQAELNTQVSLIEQRREQVQQETKKLKAEIEADQLKQVAEIQAEAGKQVAEIEKETAGLRASKARTLGQARADATTLVEGEKANGNQLKGKAFGDPVAYGMWELTKNLRDDIKINILHSGPGTLWTDVENAQLGGLGGATIMQSPAPAP